jgi:hypothetical protein
VGAFSEACSPSESFSEGESFAELASNGRLAWFSTSFSEVVFFEELSSRRGAGFPESAILAREADDGKDEKEAVCILIAVEPADRPGTQPQEASLGSAG